MRPTAYVPSETTVERGNVVAVGAIVDVVPPTGLGFPEAVDMDLPAQAVAPTATINEIVRVRKRMNETIFARRTPN